MTDLNLYGFATIAVLGLFFPGIGLFELRRKRVNADRALRKLMIEEADRAIKETDETTCRIHTHGR
jgi:hypothetical protein